MKKTDKIIMIATELFGQYGYHAVSMDRITSAASVSKKTIYNNFQSKEKLIVEVLKKRNEDCNKSLQESLKDVNEGLDELETIFNWHHEWFNDTKFTGCLFAKAANEYPDHETEISKVSTSQKENLIKTVEKTLNKIIDKSDIEIREKAEFIVMALDGATLSAQVTKNTKSARIAWEQIKLIIFG